MTDYNNSGIDRKCCYCKICKIQLPAETSTAWFLKAWPERLSSFSTEPLFTEHCGFSTTAQTQTLISHKDNTNLKILQQLHFLSLLLW